MNDINSSEFEIIIKDTQSNPDVALKATYELKQQNVKLVIGPVFFESLKYLDEIEDMIFISLTNKTVDLPNNVISSGVNSTSQFNTIKKFLKDNEIKKTVFLIPKFENEAELRKVLKKSKLKISKIHTYEKETTKEVKEK